jgi:hypothetical protein
VCQSSQHQADLCALLYNTTETCGSKDGVPVVCSFGAVCATSSDGSEACKCFYDVELKHCPKNSYYNVVGAYCTGSGGLTPSGACARKSCLNCSLQVCALQQLTVQRALAFSIQALREHLYAAMYSIVAFAVYTSTARAPVCWTRSCACAVDSSPCLCTVCLLH